MDGRLIVTLIGKVNAGKSLLCNRLLKQDLASVKAVAGWTKEVTVYPLADDVALADTPGLDDVEESVAARTFDFLGQTDLFLHVINADEGLTRTVQEAHAALRATGRPIVLVCNKADHLDDAERRAVADQVRQALPAEHLVVTSAATGEGVEDLAREVYDLLRERGEELRYAKFVRVRLPELRQRMAEEADARIRKAVARAAALALVPLPLVDVYPLLKNVRWMLRDVGRAYGLEVSEGRARQLLIGMGVSSAGVVLASLMPPVKVAVAAAITYGAGKAFKAWCAAGGKLPAEELRRIYEGERNAERQRRG